MNDREKKSSLRVERRGFKGEGAELVTEQQNGLGNLCLRNVSLERMSRAEQAQPWDAG